MFYSIYLNELSTKSVSIDLSSISWWFCVFFLCHHSLRGLKSSLQVLQAFVFLKIGPLGESIYWRVLLRNLIWASILFLVRYHALVVYMGGVCRHTFVYDSSLRTKSQTRVALAIHQSFHVLCHWVEFVVALQATWTNKNYNKKQQNNSNNNKSIVTSCKIMWIFFLIVFLVLFDQKVKIGNIISSKILLNYKEWLTILKIFYFFIYLFI